MNRVCMHHGVHVPARLQNIAMEPPFRRGRKPVLITPVQVHEDDIANRHFLISEAGRGY